MDITWSTEKAKLADLIDYEENPRQITERDFKKLVESLEQDGYHQRIIVDIHNVVIGGHARKRALLEAGYKLTDEVEVLRPSRELTPEEFQRVNIRDNLQAGDWDFDILANHFDASLLKDWGFDEKLLNFSADVEFPDLPSGDKQTLEQITFTFHPEQAQAIYDALDQAATTAGFDDKTSVNRNAAALLLICTYFMQAAA